MWQKRREVESVEKQLASEPARREKVERAVDELEWHAQQAAGNADLARLAVELDAQAAAAEARGDTVVAASARQTAADYRDGIDTSASVRGFMHPDPAALKLINVTLPAGALDVPGFPAPPATPTPTPPPGPTSHIDDTSEPGAEQLPAAVVSDAGADVPADDADVADVTGVEQTAADPGDPVLAGADDVSTTTSVAAESDAILAHFFGTELSSADAAASVPGAVDPLDPSAELAGLGVTDEVPASFAASVPDDEPDVDVGFDAAGFTDS